MTTGAVLLARLLEASNPSALQQVFNNAGGVLTYVSPSIGWRARAFGKSSSCTAGADGAIRNWQQNVIRHAEQN